MIFLGLTGKLLCFVACLLFSLNSGTLGESICVSGDMSGELSGDISGEISGDAIISKDIVLQAGEYIEEEQEVEEETNFIKPIRGGVVTSRFGTRWGRLHGGIDIADKIGTEIYASKAGEVIYAGWCGNYGNLVRIKHTDGYETYYAHCNSILVSVGEQVTQNQLIARLGMTGNATGPHVHFEIRINGQVVNPYGYIY